MTPQRLSAVSLALALVALLLGASVALRPAPDTTDLESSVSNLSSEVDQLKDRLDEIANAPSAEPVDFGPLEGRLDTLEGDIGDLRNGVADLSRSLNQACAAISDLRDPNGSFFGPPGC